MVRVTERSSKGRTREPALANEANGVTTTSVAKESPVPATNTPDITPEMRAKLAQIRSRLETSVGQVVLLVMQLPRYRHQSLGDLNHLVLEPLLRDRLAIAYGKGAGEQADRVSGPVGVAIWASVSDEVEAEIEQQVESGVFPVRLGADDWVSGKKLWLLDIIAPNSKAASAVLTSFGKISGERPVRIHPIVRRSVDPKLFKRLKQG